MQQADLGAIHAMNERNEAKSQDRAISLREERILNIWQMIFVAISPCGIYTVLFFHVVGESIQPLDMNL